MPAGSTDAPGTPFHSHTKNARAVASSINAMCKRMRPKTRTRPQRARVDTHTPAHSEPECCSQQGDYGFILLRVYGHRHCMTGGSKLVRVWLCGSAAEKQSTSQHETGLQLQTKSEQSGCMLMLYSKGKVFTFHILLL